VFTREELVRHLWDDDFSGDRRAIDVHMSNLRRKLEDDPRNPRRLQTVRGVGYRLLDGPTEA
jgi:DNA-binding response OmpR family regulator